MSYNFWDSYPLPPLSTIRGWFHTVLGADKYIPIAMSIQGKFDSIVYDLQTIIKFDRKRKEEEGKKIVLEGFNKVFSKSPTYVANIFNVNLTIYIKANEEYMERFRENLLKVEFPWLGRREDLIRIDYIDFIEVDYKDFSIFNPYKIKEGIYISKETAKDLGIGGINYRMNFKYDGELLKTTQLRYFEKIDVVYVDNGLIKKGKFLFDTEDKRIIELLGDTGV